MDKCSEKLPAVAQAFQPVLVTEAGETPTLPKKGLIPKLKTEN
jgi:hypothetical protein